MSSPTFPTSYNWLTSGSETSDDGLVSQDTQHAKSLSQRVDERASAVAKQTIKMAHDRTSLGFLSNVRWSEPEQVNKTKSTVVKLFLGDLITAIESKSSLREDPLIHVEWAKRFRAIDAAELASKLSLEKCSEYLRVISEEEYSRCLMDLEQGKAMSGSHQFEVSSHFCHKLNRGTKAGTGQDTIASYMAFVKLLDNAGTSNDEA